jgi:hypothetical protein
VAPSFPQVSNEESIKYVLKIVIGVRIVEIRMSSFCSKNRWCGGPLIFLPVFRYEYTQLQYRENTK